MNINMNAVACEYLAKGLRNRGWSDKDERPKNWFGIRIGGVHEIEKDFHVDTYGDITLTFGTKMLGDLEEIKKIISDTEQKFSVQVNVYILSSFQYQWTGW